MSQNTLKLVVANADSAVADTLNIITLANNEDPRKMNLDGVERIDLNFPKFTDGRAFSQAFLLRRRLGFKGEIRATGNVLIDQLLQMQRCGFDAALLREDQNLAVAQRQLDHYQAFYQGDAVLSTPHFAVAESPVNSGVAA